MFDGRPDIRIHHSGRDFAHADSKRLQFLPQASGDVVLITGTTGNLGSHLLEHLLNDQTVVKVYALNRVSSDKVDRQRQAFRRYGIPDSYLDSPKLCLIEGDLTHHHFDLGSDLFGQVSAGDVVYLVSYFLIHLNADSFISDTYYSCR